MIATCTITCNLGGVPRQGILQPHWAQVAIIFAVGCKSFEALLAVVKHKRRCAGDHPTNDVLSSHADCRAAGFGSLGFSSTGRERWLQMRHIQPCLEACPAVVIIQKLQHTLNCRQNIKLQIQDNMPVAEIEESCCQQLLPVEE